MAAWPCQISRHIWSTPFFITMHACWTGQHADAGMQVHQVPSPQSRVPSPKSPVPTGCLPASLPSCQPCLSQSAFQISWSAETNGQIPVRYVYPRGIRRDFSLKRSPDWTVQGQHDSVASPPLACGIMVGDLQSVFCPKPSRIHSGTFWSTFWSICASGCNVTAAT